MFLDGQFGRNAFIKNKEYLFFSGYDYLAIHTIPAFCSLVSKGLQKYGWVYPSSRISNTQIELFEKCEEKLSNITQTEETVLFGSGFTAGQSCLSIFDSPIENAPLSHPAILQKKSSDIEFQEWQKQIINRSDKNKLIWASDAINNFSLKKYDFDPFLNCKQKGVHLIIDDSHGIGVTGKNGGGVAEYMCRNKDFNYLFTYSMGKAYGIEAGAVSTTKSLAQKLRKLPSFTAVTPPSPGPLYAFLHERELYAMQREKLKQNIQYAIKLFKEIPDISIHPELPIVLLPSYIQAQKYFENGFIISSFAYPDPNGEKINRLVLNAAHTKEDLEKVFALTIKQLQTYKHTFS